MDEANVSAEIEHAAGLLDQVGNDGMIVGYHATLLDPAAAHSEGLLPRSSGRTENVWAGTGDNTFVSDDHVYFFQHEADAAIYFDNHRLPKSAQRREAAAVYSARLPVERLDVDPEDLASYLSYEQPSLPADIRFDFRGERGEDQAAIYAAGVQVLDELQRASAQLTEGLPTDAYSAERVQIAWQVYEALPEIKRQVLVAACLYGGAGSGNSVRLMHRGPIKELHYEPVATDWARSGMTVRHEHGGTYERYVRHRLAEQAWPVRRESELYKSLETHHERLAFRDCAWIESDQELRAEIDRRMEARERTLAMMAMRRERSRERHAGDPELLAQWEAEQQDNAELHARKREREAAWLDAPVLSDLADAVQPAHEAASGQPELGID